ncbi:hypothetical protein A5784_35255 [Mycobacterium sp. 852013-50091_SCH5140682]|uniref:hypothetical protein n=1 Tax=Mycobacterium sp. 852013-50091_SCH5140682 TaxID=1834109 RepID=UPI0007EAD7FF|nr:hypothetical protein [Mycobacterium sp. 852013-50091_SCH5140682]OBC11454.1 hypothetical protein A5784_35255 [Mycobacterium sp. 852013-50091_SCH5140682]
MKRLLAAVFGAAAIGALAAVPAQADPGPGPGMCQYLGANYNTYYPCTEYQPWLPYGTGDNPPYGSQLPASQCTGINVHNVGCS